MSRYVSGLPINAKDIYNGIINDLKTKQYTPNNINICFYDNYTEYTFFSSDDNDLAYSITFGIILKCRGQEVKCSFFCSSPSQYKKNDPMTDASDFKINNKYASYLLEISKNCGFSVIAPIPDGSIVDFIVYYSESDAHSAYLKYKEIKQRSYYKNQIPQKTENSTTKIIVGIIAAIVIIYLISS